jgi:hypothetical protein
MALGEPFPSPCNASPKAALWPIDVKGIIQFIMRIGQATRLAMGSRERWETGLRVVERYRLSNTHRAEGARAVFLRLVAA